MKKMLVLFSLLISTSSFANVQTLPSCEELSKLWTTNYWYKLKPNLPWGNLACNKKTAQLKKLEHAAIHLARAAYVLDKTVFNYQLPVGPIVSYGRIQAPPKSMLNWVAVRMNGVVVDYFAKYAYASPATKKIHLTYDDVGIGKPLTIGIGLAGQIIHETRHVGKTFYGHVECTIPEASGPNCDPTISEEFDNGGSHAVAALWLAYIARNSFWPEKDREEAASVVRWVLYNRINASFEVRNAWAQRYLWEKLWE